MRPRKVAFFTIFSYLRKCWENWIKGWYCFFFSEGIRSWTRQTARPEYKAVGSPRSYGPIHFKVKIWEFLWNHTWKIQDSELGSIPTSAVSAPGQPGLCFSSLCYRSKGQQEQKKITSSEGECGISWEVRTLYCWLLSIISRARGISATERSN